MPFASAAPAFLATLLVGSEDYEILNYLLINARGHRAAKTWGQIETHCAGLGIVVDQRRFQQGLLAQSRDGDVFIGSWHGGYFAIDNRADAVVMADFYQTRIARETQHLDHLKNLVTRSGWLPI